MALWILPKRGLLCVGAKANVPLCGGKKLNKKMCGGENKKYRRVGFECQPSYCPIVCFKSPIHLSNFVKRFCLSVVSFPLAANVSGLKEVGDFGAQNCQPTTKLY